MQFSSIQKKTGKERPGIECSGLILTLLPVGSDSSAWSSSMWRWAPQLGLRPAAIWGKILSPRLGDVVHSGIGLSYRPACQWSLAGRYDNPISPSQVLRIGLQLQHSQAFINSAHHRKRSRIGLRSNLFISYFKSCPKKPFIYILSSCNDKIPKSQNKYSQERNCTATVPVPTFMFLRAI